VRKWGKKKCDAARIERDEGGVLRAIGPSVLSIKLIQELYILS